MDLLKMHMSKALGKSSIICGIVFPLCAVCGILFCVNWKFGIGLMFLLVMLPFNYLFPNLAMLPVFFAIPFDRLARVGPESTITFAKILLVLIIIAWVVRFLTTKDTKPIKLLRGNYLFFLSLLFLVFSFTSSINSNHDEAFWAHFLRRVNVVFLFWLIINYLHSKTLLLRVWKVLLLAYIVVGFIGIYEIHSGESILTTYWGEADPQLLYTQKSTSARVIGPGGDPDFHAVSIIFPSLIAGFFFLYMAKSKFWKLMLILFMTIMLINMIGTGSRGGLVSLLIGITVLWLFSKMRYKYVMAVLTPLGVLACVLIFNVFNPEMPTERYTGGGAQSIIYRVGWMRMGFSMIEEHPLIGIGTGNVPGEYNRHVKGVPSVPRQPHWTHNSFLQIWVENGIFGFLVYLSIFVMSGVMMWVVITKASDPHTRSLGVMLLAVLLSYFFFAGTSNVVENENYWIVFAMCYVVYTFFTNETNRAELMNPPPTNRKPGQ